jgi:tetratricopeptide (TPR) repeat protein
MTLLNEGNAARDQGDYGGARRCYEESMALSEALGNQWAVGQGFVQSGICALCEGDVAAAKHFLEQSQALFQDAGDRREVAGVLSRLGETARVTGAYEQAAALQAASLELARVFADPGLESGAKHALGLLALDQRQYGRAAAILREAISLRRDLVAVAVRCAGLAALAGAWAALGRDVLAARLIGAVDAGLARSGARIEPYEESVWAPLIAAAQAACDPDVWQAACAAGRAMSLEEAVAYALAEGPPDA